MLKEFKEFAIKGNVIDLAVGVVIGGAFSKIVSSLVNDIIMPFIGLLTGGVNFTYLKIVLREKHGDVPALTFNYGQFIQNIIDFLIIAFSIFMFVKVINKFKKDQVTKEEAKQNTQEQLLTEIRDLLKQNVIK
ncbi:large conductance mechanosensitive channel [Clostridium cavendishii DSM 21758]|uniref:Large-conductance mechanosensitive channel n=1 Tax=Clostridium cavendishii DSM 21758 TaxID=1121302 RepID=A0A1M6NRF2_9CLOT|nr:large-conductance mechanosensitive channel protein MscL [Clostridium cavendishii]SHJ98321.1 large conductance mechanosensitive channel [Clostridium cavendishii DSM 21758]